MSPIFTVRQMFENCEKRWVASEKRATDAEKDLQKLQSLIQRSAALLSPFVEDGAAIPRGEARDLLQQLRNTRTKELTE